MDNLVVQFSRLWGQKEVTVILAAEEVAKILKEYDSLEMRDLMQQWADEFDDSIFCDPEDFFETKIEELCCAKKADKTWRIPVVWEVSAVITVTAPTLKEAMEIARDDKGETPLPDDSDYSEGSWALAHDNPDEIRSLYNDGQKDSQERM